MSVIAWDGKTIAADKRAVSEGLQRTTTKLYIHNNSVLGFVGSQAHGLALVDWYKNGADVTKYPEFQKTEDWTRLIVAEYCMCKTYEQTPYPLTVEDTRSAWGSGRDYALGAMYAGKNAEEAVRVASFYDINCGNGITIFNLKDLAE